MNVEAVTMTMPRYEARQAYRAYKAQLTSPKVTREDVMLYRALVRGCKVIDAPRAIVEAGLNTTGHPKLAICRADATWCYLDNWWVAGHNQAVFSHRGGRFVRGRRELFAGEVAGPHDETERAEDR